MSTQDTTDTAAADSVISLPKGGGAVSGLGEKFSPDLFTGTGNFSVPLSVPSGRGGLQPQLALTYSTGNGNGPFGLGWQLGLSGVARRTSHGLPRYADVPDADGTRADVFVLSGAEDLVPVAGRHPGRVSYRPRSEGMFARIEHVKDGVGDYWEVRAKDGSRTRYGTPRPEDAPAGWRDPAVAADPAAPGRVFGWRITETADPLGNLIRYSYLRDTGRQAGHEWDQPLLARISYADHGDRSDPSFLVTVDFDHSPRPDPFSDHRAGFETRTSLRCDTVRVTTHAADGVKRVVREYRLGYVQAAFNGVSLLDRVTVVGIDESAPDGQPAVEAMPPLVFAYSGFDPAARGFRPLTGPGLPTTGLDDPAMALVDLRGVGLPDLVELGAAHRVWRNAGDGRFELPRLLPEAPPQSLADPGVRFIDADGDGRAELLVPAPASGSRTAGAAAGYYPTAPGGGWSRGSFRPYRQAPSVSLADPQVRLIDLDGDGLTDVLRSGSRLECWFNDRDPRKAWQRRATGSGPLPQVDLADPGVRLADMTGDGLQDLVLVRNGNISYWPNLGFNRWGARVAMRDAPRLPDRYDPRRVLLGDIDGDGAADLVYVDDGRVLVWGNRTGNAWSPEPVTIRGTPAAAGPDSLQLCDLYGTGMAGLLFGRTAGGRAGSAMRFLDFTGGTKPYLLAGMDNNLGAVTRVTYGASTAEYLRDQQDPGTRWRTTLPFPVQVVTKVEVTDLFSGGVLTTGYRYHHGHWDGVEREFRGFARVDRVEGETFAETSGRMSDGTPRDTAATGPGGVPAGHFSPPTLTKTWFHQGAVPGAGPGQWAELDLRAEFWDGDAPMLHRPAWQDAYLAALPGDARRTALRTMRGRVLRTELYALDGTAREARPYTVTEAVAGVREQSAPAAAEGDRERIFFPFAQATRTTRWERGTDPMTSFGFVADYDDYGCATGRLSFAVPRGRDPLAAAEPGGEPYLATYETTEYARRDDEGLYLVDRVARKTEFEVVNDGRLAVPDLRAAVLAGPQAAGPGTGVSLRLIGHTRTFYDGAAFTGLAAGVLGDHGLAVRSESLAFTGGFLDELFDPADPAAVTPRPPYLNPDGAVSWPAGHPPEFTAALAPLAGYVHYADDEVPGSPGGYYITTARHRYDVHDAGRVPRGLVVASLDALGAQTLFGYDEYDLLPVSTVDAAGLTRTAGNDPRLLRPHTVTDANGSTSTVAYSPLGLVTARFARGSGGEGDAVLPGTRITYDLLAYVSRGEPASVRSVVRVHHDTDTGVPADRRDDVQVSVQYSDGFGRVLQTRSQAEDTLFGDPVFGGGVIPQDLLADTGDTVGRTRAAGDPDNVVVSGLQRYDNKGRVVQTHEPLFATGYGYTDPSQAQSGQHTSTFYDPLGQAVRTVQPDGSEQRVVPGVPADLADPDVFAATAWESFTYDADDNAGRTHPGATEDFRSHWNTPESIEVDALGRTVRAVQRNGPAAGDRFTTASRYDIQGNLLTVTDPLGRVAFRYHYDLAKRRWRIEGADGGRQDSVPDALGTPVETRDGKGALVMAACDALRRPVRVWARDGTSDPLTLRQRIEYGDGGTPDQPAAEREAARELNLLGRPVRHHDEAGLLTVAAVDFKGNVLESERRVIADAPLLAGYAAAAGNGWRVAPFRVDWTPAAGQDQAAHDDTLLEPSGYTTTTRYDALGRVAGHVFPAAVDGTRAELLPSYNRAGSLEAVSLDGTVHVQRIAYDAKGQRALVAYGNGVLTRYAYDPLTCRLARVRTEPFTADGAAYHPAGAVIEDRGYDYDLVGNVTAVRDRTPGSGIPGNPEALAAADPVLRRLLGGGDALDRHFAYDPLYRLVSATGREFQSPAPGDPWSDMPRGTDVTRTQAYTETYTYDPAGNLLALVHGGAGAFRRDFVPDPGGDRLLRMTSGGTPYDYAYDARGNLVAEASSRHFGWNHADRMTSFATQAEGAEPSVHAHYLHDATGRRVKKLVRRQGGAFEVTHYLDGTFEHHRWSVGTPSAGANNHVHVMDDRQRVALVRLGTPHPDDPGPAVAFQLGDHLGSCTAIVDGAGVLTNREEYTPYGETSFGSHTRKRYRFTGCERDEESGVSHHGARSYHPALARWTSTDPRLPGPAEGALLANPYRYVRNNPLMFSDPDGTDVYILANLSGREIDYAAVATRKAEIDAKLSAEGRTDKDHVYVLTAFDLGELEGKVAEKVKDAKEKGYGKTVEFSEWGHGGRDGPRGDKVVAQKVRLSEEDPKQLKFEVWQRIDFNFEPGHSIAAFYGCRELGFAERFLAAQPNLQYVAGFDVRSYPSWQSGTYDWHWNEGYDSTRDASLAQSRLSGRSPFVWFVGQGRLRRADNSIGVRTEGDKKIIEAVGSTTNLTVVDRAGNERGQDPNADIDTLNRQPWAPWIREQNRP
ncbi:SpvB/TcaC N-terminal domain-containing protein [Streptomyces sp. NPDC049040]|uniref:SpvB/TcaC N-terminal domain-containing protein n=1 Tax=Streptomyces sp. NPDC049040 TaxID=3365593 RepID=UPI00371C1E35